MSTGLKVNYGKSCIVPINVSQEQTKILAGTFGCSKGSIPPFTYLGLPLGTTKPNVVDHSPIINKMQRKLPATNKFLALAGRVTYISSAVRSMPVYAMCTLKLHATIDDHIDKLSRAALWRGKEMDLRGKALVAWNKCTIPKEKGGLGSRTSDYRMRLYCSRTWISSITGRMSYG